MPEAKAMLSAVTALFVVALLVAERKASLRGVWLTKPLASLGFVLVACASGAFGSTYGLTILTGLIACALGDVLLITPGAGKAFLAGMASFALGHAAYATAFWQLGIDRNATRLGLGAMSVIAILTLRWLAPRLPGDMRIPIHVYIAIISVMVALAGGASAASGDPWIAVGATAFAISDLSVARDRFVKPGFVNVLWGLPLYYAAQLVLALTPH